jgi:hypothetical protein
MSGRGAGSASGRPDDGGDQSTEAPPAQAKHNRVQRRRARLTSELASLMHPPSVPHQNQDCRERAAEAGANSTVAGWYKRVVDLAMVWPLCLWRQLSCWTRQQTLTDEARRRGEQAMREAFTGLHAANGQRIRAQNTRRFRVLPG